MQVSNPNNIKIYDLSHGKSLPDFISEKKKRSLMKKDVDLQRRIELIQDFTMPTVSHTIKMSSDGQYIFVSGTYKPRVRCYDVKDLSLKYERCIDSEVVTFSILSNDYSKTAFLLQDRNVEFHTPQGTHFKIRFPKFGRDMAYHPANCDLMLVGTGSEIYRLNLDQGRFLKSFETHSKELTKCVVNPEHHLVMAGGVDGHVECWDPRSKCRVGILDCSIGLINMKLNETPQVSCLKFSGGQHLGVGTSSGHVLLYDIRGNRPYVVKDHYYDLPIHSIAFNKTNDLVISSDKQCVKLWNEHTGEPITAVEVSSYVNDMHVVDGSGLFFLANESPKVFTYFIPMLGPAPKWCSFLDNLTEELEENPIHEIYDDYKFVTAKEVESLGLSNLIGSNLLRAYMHGYFMDMKLYDKAVSVANPFAYKEYRKQKIAEKMEESRTNRAEVKKAPKVNKQLAERLQNFTEMKATNTKKRLQQNSANQLLQDSRFKAMFENPDFQVDDKSEEFSLMYQKNRLPSSLLSAKSKKNERHALIDEDDVSSDDETDDSESDSQSWNKDSLPQNSVIASGPKMFEIKPDALQKGKSFSTLHDLTELDVKKPKRKIATLEDRMKNKNTNFSKSEQTTKSREIKFELEEETEKKKKYTEADKLHQAERKKLRRPPSKLMRNETSKKPFAKYH